jgi:multidrug efflux pump subunit AcrA (membrane-fusion protein)
VAQLEQLLAVAPLGIREAETGLAVAESRLARARRQVERCRVRAPFTGRVVRTTVEAGQFVTPAIPSAVVLADDSVLELRVPLDARQAIHRLQFERDAEAGGGPAWFARPQSVEVNVRWTEAPDTHQWTGVLDRVEELSATTRMLTVVIRVDQRQATNSRGFPMVEGMFCSVTIPGRTLTGVYRVPRWAITVEQAVYKVVKERLVTQPVHVAHTVGEVALVDKGLAQGDVVIVTRLGDPLENRRVALRRVDAKDIFP